ncbi:MAG: B12-binding domain-containing radical SAM protein [Bacteroidales bacterium]|nr:B12-binding domain-containing radical SAM protein [Bacteroidales bacterium]MBN2762620.1 B12-binding domain-containing radical SAM protein [Bacteroidales bacterium]
MNILFVEPRGAFSNVFDQYMTIPMLGPVNLATIADKAGFNVAIINENILRRKITPDELATADMLCVSCMTATITRGREIAREYKDIRSAAGKKSHSIIGGIHASMMPDDVVNDFDQVFVGEAENHIIDLLSGRFPDKIVHGAPVQDMDTIPVPNFKLLKGWEKMKIFPIMTSRGCPYNCNFCSVTEMFGRGYRVRGVDKVMEEVISHRDHRIFFVDDHFVVNKRRTHEILDRMEAIGFRGKKWSAQLRVEVARDIPLVKRMKETGCATVYIGFESINPQSLEEMHKGQTVEDIRLSIDVFRKNGILVHGMFMFGSDSDTCDIFAATSDFCLNSRISSVQYMVLTPLPGTEFYRRIEHEGRLLHKKWEYYDAMHVVFKPRNLLPDELQQGMISCFSDFYSYTSSLNDAVNAVGETVITFFRRIYTKAHFPSFVPALLKLFGRKIVMSWISYNREYLQYLKKIR